MTKDLVFEFLANEGYRPSYDSDGDVQFKAEGFNFLYYANDNDQDFFQLAFPGILDVTPDNREMVLEACNAVTLNVKVAKAAIVPSGSVWLFFEILLDKNPQIGDIMPRAINILLHAFRTFSEKLN